jgi:hypothetical protein
MLWSSRSDRELCCGRLVLTYLGERIAVSTAAETALNINHQTERIIMRVVKFLLNLIVSLLPARGVFASASCIRGDWSQGRRDIMVRDWYQG